MWSSWSKITFKGFHEIKSFLDTNKYFKMENGQTVNVEFPLSWKESFAHGLFIDRKE